MDKKQTNYDRIKSMSLEQLAEFLYSASDEICFANCSRDTGNKFACKFGNDVSFENCKNCMKEYLESEVQGG